MKKFLLIAGLILLFAAEILRVYFIMPFPGSQKANTIDIAYFIGRHIWWLRGIALLMIIYPAILIFKNAARWKKAGLVLLFIAYGVIAYMLNFTMEADKMFLQPGTLAFAGQKENKIPEDKLVLGVIINGRAKAYPIQLIGYHHQVVDTFGNVNVMVTYCTVCRTGRVYSTYIQEAEKFDTFRLVGMDHFNAMFEDAGTKSWWQQSTGMAIAGPLKGAQLKELPSEQMRLGAWLRKHPESIIMQPDTTYKEKFEKMASYDKGLSKSDLTKRDSGSWNAKSWVIGVQHLETARAYDWNQLVKDRIIQDSLPWYPIMITLESDTASFHAFNTLVDGQNLRFERADAESTLKDTNTGSLWNADGKSISGPLVGKQLMQIQAYQEFWHSWQTFHPATTKYK